MEYPACVPAEVRKYTTGLIEGDKWEPRGLAPAVAAAEQWLTEIKQAIEVRTRDGETESLVSLKRQ